MKLLLHVCCAPCAIYPIEEAKKSGFDIVGYFFNPNIHPLAEYERRRRYAEMLFEKEKLDFVSKDYSISVYMHSISSYDSSERCRFCWDMRLKGTLDYAKSCSFDAFTTTLLGSPYQDHEYIKAMCQEAGNRFGIAFFYMDFRMGFKESHKYARENGIYCQNYCGCIFSIIEREERYFVTRKHIKNR